jgi:hypothetical protein
VLRKAAVTIKKVKISASLTLVLAVVFGLVSLLPGCQGLASAPAIGLGTLNVTIRLIDLYSAHVELEEPISWCARSAI